MIQNPIQTIEREARKRSHRFSDRAWKQWLDEGGVRLAQALQQTAWQTGEREAVFENTLRLAAEAVSCGYLPYRSEQTASSWFDWVWTEELSRRLPIRSPQEALQELAALWNLSEALEQGAPWQRRLLFLFRDQLTPNLPLRNFLVSIDAKLSPQGLESLSENSRHWNSRFFTLSDFSPYALPGAPKFIAPRIVGIPVRDSESLSLYLMAPEPTPLGAGSVSLWADPSTPTIPVSHESLTFREQHRLGEIEHETGNEWFWVGVPALSQRIYFAWSDLKGPR